MRRAILAVLVLCGAVCASGQEFRATLEGLVTDTSGAAVSGARVVATNVGNNVPAETVSDSDGHYVISYLTPGTYVVTVEKPGFQKIVRQGVNLNVAEHATIDFLDSRRSEPDHYRLSQCRHIRDADGRSGAGDYLDNGAGYAAARTQSVCDCVVLSGRD